jgi:hypothetical protein
MVVNLFDSSPQLLPDLLRLLLVHLVVRPKRLQGEKRE